MNWRHAGIGIPGNPHAQLYERGPLRVIVGHEEGRWHVSISCAGRYPTWDEIADARYHFITEKIDMALILPPPEDYVNLQGPRQVFHLWESRDPGLPTERGEAMMRTLEDGTEASTKQPDASRRAR